MPSLPPSLECDCRGLYLFKKVKNAAQNIISPNHHTISMDKIEENGKQNLWKMLSTQYYNRYHKNCLLKVFSILAFLVIFDHRNSHNKMTWLPHHEGKEGYYLFSHISHRAISWMFRRQLCARALYSGCLEET